MATITIFTTPARAQTGNDIPNVYVDCWRCDEDYIQTEIDYVNYVRNRQDADIHLLVTRQRTGGEGREYTLTFIGLGDFKSVSDTLVFITTQDDTDDQVRQEMVRVTELGLVPFLTKTSLAKNLSVSFQQARVPDPQVSEDKWNHWVYRINVNSFLNGEQTTSSISLWGSLGARRVTEDWKITISTNGSYNEDNFEYGDQTYQSIFRSNSFKTSVIRSLSDHWSIGVWANSYSSTYSNIDRDLSIVPGIEYNFYPYSESTRRQLRWEYKIGAKYRDYTEETVYFKLNEQLLEESMDITLDLIQPWGSVSTTLSGSHYFHDLNKNQLQIYSRLSLKLVKGLTLNLNGRLSRIRDQLSLPSSGQTLEEVLLRRKELATQYNYWASIGVSYTFGSIYTPVVNARFGNW